MYFLTPLWVCYPTGYTQIVLFFPQVVNERIVRLYLYPNKKSLDGIPKRTKFKTGTEFEIDEIKWISFAEIHNHYKARPFIADINDIVTKFKNKEEYHSRPLTKKGWGKKMPITNQDFFADPLWLSLIKSPSVLSQNDSGLVLETYEEESGEGDANAQLNQVLPNVRLFMDKFQERNAQFDQVLPNLMRQCPQEHSQNDSGLETSEEESREDVQKNQILPNVRLFMDRCEALKISCDKRNEKI